MTDRPTGQTERPPDDEEVVEGARNRDPEAYAALVRRHLDLLVAGPEMRPVTGETALVGALGAAPACGGSGSGADAAALAQLRAVLLLAGGSDSLEPAAAALLAAARDAGDGQSADGDLLAALRREAAAQGLAAPAGPPGDLISALRALAQAAHSAYPAGFDLQVQGADAAMAVPTGTSAR